MKGILMENTPTAAGEAPQAPQTEAHLLEEWRRLPPPDSEYEISNFGRLRCLSRNRGNKNGTYGSNRGGGYRQRAIYRDGKRRHFYIHRLVATAFAPNPENKPFVNHIDGNPNNNRSDNLEWVTSSENEYHKHKFLSPKHGAPIPTLCVEYGTVFETAKDAAICYNLCDSSIRRVLRGEQKTAGGLHWKKI